MGLWVNYQFSKNRPLADSFIESQCPSVGLSPSHATFFKASHWPSGHMIRSRPLIGRPPKIVSKILEEISFKDFGGKLFQWFWRKIVSKILEENCLKDFGGKLFHRFWRKIVSNILEEISFKDFEKISFKDFGGKLLERF